MSTIRTWLRRILCAHRWQFDRLAASPYGPLVKSRCIRCGAGRWRTDFE